MAAGCVHGDGPKLGSRAGTWGLLVQAPLRFSAHSRSRNCRAKKPSGQAHRCVAVKAGTPSCRAFASSCGRKRRRLLGGEWACRAASADTVHRGAGRRAPWISPSLACKVGKGTGGRGHMQARGGEGCKRAWGMSQSLQMPRILHPAPTWKKRRVSPPVQPGRSNAVASCFSDSCGQPRGTRRMMMAAAEPGRAAEAAAAWTGGAEPPRREGPDPARALPRHPVQAQQHVEAASPSRSRLAVGSPRCHPQAAWSGHCPGPKSR